MCAPYKIEIGIQALGMMQTYTLYSLRKTSETMATCLNDVDMQK